MKQQRMMRDDQIRPVQCSVMGNFNRCIEREKNVADVRLCAANLYSAIVSLPCCRWRYPFFQKVLKFSYRH